MAVTGNDLARLEGRPDVLGNLLVRSFLTNLGSHLLDPSEDFLVSETVEGSGETVQGSTEGKEGVRESGTDQVTSVSGNVTTLVVRVDGDVQSHELDKVSVVTETEQGSQVGRVVLAGVNGRELAVTEDVSEDSASNVGELGNEIHGVIEGGLPVLLLVDTVRVGLGEGRVVVKLSRIASAIDRIFHQNKALTALTAMANWVMGWRVFGHRSINSSTNLGMAALAAHS